MPHAKHRQSAPQGEEIRALLSLREAALLADVAEAKVRKDIETGLLPPIKSRDRERLFFRWADVFIFAAVYKSDLLSGPLRKQAFAALEARLEPSRRRHFYNRLEADALLAATCERSECVFAASGRLQLDDYLYIDLAQLAADLAPRVDVYAEGLGRIEEKEGVLGGETVFKNTRLSVNHVGKLRDGGEAVATIIEDYPYLREDDVEFARLYFKAHPVVGRPRLHQETDRAGRPSTR